MYFLVAAFCFILGAAIGSFLSVVIHRLPKKEKGILKGRSHCPQCRQKLKVRDLIPILSYLTLYGRCRYCGKRIPIIYPLLEITTALAFFFAFHVSHILSFSATANLHEFNLLQLPYLILLFIYFGILIFTFFYDILYLEVADRVLVPGIILALTATILPQTPHVVDALLGALIGFSFFGLQILISKGKWLGGGDLRIALFMGLILGWKMLILGLILSYFVGSIISIIVIITKKGGLKTRIPFAPFLVIGTVLALFYGQTILNWYLNFLYSF